MNGPPCPRCDAADGRIALLTTMVTYFVCEVCSHRWHIPTPSRTPDAQMLLSPESGHGVVPI